MVATRMDGHDVVLDFSVFLLNRLARAWNVTTPEAYGILQSRGAFQNYILPNWETLHSEGTDALLEDVTGYVRNRGVADICLAPIDATADPFYSKENMAHLRRSIAQVEHGRAVARDLVGAEGD